jgi:hypothetical protein
VGRIVLREENDDRCNRCTFFYPHPARACERGIERPAPSAPGSSGFDRRSSRGMQKSPGDCSSGLRLRADRCPADPRPVVPRPASPSMT